MPFLGGTDSSTLVSGLRLGWLLLLEKRKKSMTREEGNQKCLFTNRRNGGKQKQPVCHQVLARGYFYSGHLRRKKKIILHYETTEKNQRLWTFQVSIFKAVFREHFSDLGECFCMQLKIDENVQPYTSMTSIKCNTKTNKISSSNMIWEKYSRASVGIECGALIKWYSKWTISHTHNNNRKLCWVTTLTAKFYLLNLVFKLNQVFAFINQFHLIKFHCALLRKNIPTSKVLPQPRVFICFVLTFECNQISNNVS